MRKSKIQMTAAALAAVMLLGGCGEAPYDLTEEEENIIVNYSAHVVAKYNRYQQEGLAYVAPAEEEETETEESEAQETASGDDAPQGSVSAEGAEADAETSGALQTATLEELFGVPGLEIDYIGVRLSDSYMEDTYFAMYPDAGKQYLVMGIDITNTGDEAVTVDYLTMNPGFQVTVNDEIVSSSEFTILTGDFSTFEGTIVPAETKETVLLFQVPDTVEAVERLELVVSAGDNYQIILENE